MNNPRTLVNIFSMLQDRGYPLPSEIEWYIRTHDQTKEDEYLIKFNDDANYPMETEIGSFPGDEDPDVHFALPYTKVFTKQLNGETVYTYLHIAEEIKETDVDRERGFALRHYQMMPQPSIIEDDPPVEQYSYMECLLLISRHKRSTINVTANMVERSLGVMREYANIYRKGDVRKFVTPIFELQLMYEQNFIFNPTKHVLVDQHRLLSFDEQTGVMSDPLLMTDGDIREKYMNAGDVSNVRALSRFPIINGNDPLVQWYLAMSTNVFEIVRRNPFAKHTMHNEISYRMVFHPYFFSSFVAHTAFRQEESDFIDVNFADQIYCWPANNTDLGTGLVTSDYNTVLTRQRVLEIFPTMYMHHKVGDADLFIFRGAADFLFNTETLRTTLIIEGAQGRYQHPRIASNVRQLVCNNTSISDARDLVATKFKIDKPVASAYRYGETGYYSFHSIVERSYTIGVAIGDKMTIVLANGLVEGSALASELLIGGDVYVILNGSEKELFKAMAPTYEFLQQKIKINNGGRAAGVRNVQEDEEVSGNEETSDGDGNIQSESEQESDEYEE